MNGNIPLQSLPSPERSSNPSLHLHVNEPGVFEQVVSSWQSSWWLEHSSKSTETEVPYLTLLVILCHTVEVTLA